MAKKVRRVRRKKREVTPSDDEIIPVEPELTTEEQLAEEYAYVLLDLRRVFRIAIAMFLLLILLNLIL